MRILLPLPLLLLLLLPACAGVGAPVGAPTASPQPTVTSAANPTIPGIRFGGWQNHQGATVIRVIDGDTIQVEILGKQYRVRYIGMDTPETVDPRRPVGCFGREASDRNREIVGGRVVALEKDVSDTDEFGRLLRYVWVGAVAPSEQPRMVNAMLVEEGFALAATYPPDVKYAENFAHLQSEARHAGRGLWGACTEREPLTQTPSPTSGACDFSGTDEPVIKGNINHRTGKKIYHVPGGYYYDNTVIDEAAGERWFCTEADAVDAGWWKSKR